MVDTAVDGDEIDGYRLWAAALDIGWAEPSGRAGPTAHDELSLPSRQVPWEATEHSASGTMAKPTGWHAGPG